MGYPDFYIYIPSTCISLLLRFLQIIFIDQEVDIADLALAQQRLHPPWHLWALSPARLVSRPN